MTVNEATLDFVRQHRNDDVRRLALAVPRDGEVDVSWALQQIAGWQAARTKLPSWAATEGLLYPPHLNMEQCSSEVTARYKGRLISRLLSAIEKSDEARFSEDTPLLVDLTGGFGVDFAFMAPGRAGERCVYVEHDAQLCAISSGNFPLLGLSQAQVVNGDGVDYLHGLSHAALIYLDPARRDDHGGKTYAISDCKPDVLALGRELTEKAEAVALKLSPMLDWHKAVNDLDDSVGRHVVREVHIVSVRNECKELLLVLSNHLYGEALPEGGVRLFCVNDDEEYESVRQLPDGDPQPFMSPGDTPCYLYEPNASLMKAGIFTELAAVYHVSQVAPHSHLFVSFDDEPRMDFPGRRFQISTISSMNRREIKTALAHVETANVSVRNFPLTAEQLRKRLKLRDGGADYLFGTTLSDGSHVLFVCRKVS